VGKIYHMGVPIDIVEGSNGTDDEASWVERFNSQGPEWMVPGDGELLENNYASAAFMDAQVGKVLNPLREEGLEDNTIVVFTSDHGFHLCEHDFWMKAGLWLKTSKKQLIAKLEELGGKRPGRCLQDEKIHGKEG